MKNFPLRPLAPACRGALAALLLLAPRHLSAADAPSKETAPPPKTFAEFRAAMADPTRAAQLLPLGNPPDAALVKGVAEALSQQPARVDTLLAEYGQWHDDGRGTPRVKRPQRLSPAHTTEDWRAAWEFLLLAPPTPETVFMQGDSRITDALAAIGNPASIPVLQLAFRQAAAQPHPHDDCAPLQMQFKILVALCRFRSPAGLEALLAAPDQGKAPNLTVNGRSLQEWPARLIAEGNASERAQWRSVLANYRRQPSGAAQAPRLAEIQAALDAADR